MLALNIINKNSQELLNALDYNQVAPILFLQVEKLFSTLIPNSDYGLRVFPLLCFWLSLFFFYKISKNLFKNSCTIIFALSLFTFNSKLIYYSSEVKQYMADVLVLTSIYYLILKLNTNEKINYYVLSIAGLISIFLSNVAPIVLFSVGLYMIYNKFKQKNIKTKYLATLFLIWIIPFLFYFYFFIYNHPTKNIMLAYWANENVFLPSNPFKIEFYVFLYSKCVVVFKNLLPYIYVLPILFFVGILNLIKNKLELLLLFLTPIVLHLFLSALKMYPFDLRLILYTCPVFIFIISFGFEYLSNYFSSRFQNLKLNYFRFIIPVLLLIVFFLNPFPYQKEELKMSINYIRQKSKKEDKIYVYYGAITAFEYYQKTNDVLANLTVVNGTENRANKLNYLKDFKNFNGKFWLLFSHGHNDEENYIISSLKTQGFTKIDSYNTVGSSVYLIDFK